MCKELYTKLRHLTHLIICSFGIDDRCLIARKFNGHEAPHPILWKLSILFSLFLVGAGHCYHYFLLCYIVFVGGGGGGGAAAFYHLLLHHVIQFNIYARKYKRHNCDERRTTINSKTVVISSHTLLSWQYCFIFVCLVFVALFFRSLFSSFFRWKAVKRMAIISFVVSGHLIFLCATLYSMYRTIVTSAAINLYNQSASRRLQFTSNQILFLVFAFDLFHLFFVLCVSLLLLLLHLLLLLPDLSICGTCFRRTLSFAVHAFVFIYCLNNVLIVRWSQMGSTRWWFISIRLF